MNPAGGPPPRLPGPPSELLATTLIVTPAEANDHENGTRTIGRLVAFGEVLPPAGRRTMLAILVRRCPHCGHAHLHRARRAGPWARTGSCGASYLVVVAASVVAA